MPKTFPAFKRRPKLGLLVNVYSKMVAAFDLARPETGYLLLIRN